MLGALICYEAVFPELARDRVAQGAQILIRYQQRRVVQP